MGDLRGQPLQPPIKPAELKAKGTCYVGWRDARAGACFAVVGPGPDDVRRLEHYAVHSPTGMEWGYGGSGPAAVVAAILVLFRVP